MARTFGLLRPLGFLAVTWYRHIADSGTAGTVWMDAELGWHDYRPGMRARVAVGRKTGDWGSSGGFIMTPLSRFYARYLPAPLVWGAVTLTYAAGLMLIAFFGSEGGTDIIYIDLE